jgi:hypothetical protein
LHDDAFNAIAIALVPDLAGPDRALLQEALKLERARVDGVLAALLANSVNRGVQ